MKIDKYIVLDIETGIAPDAEEFYPEFVYKKKKTASGKKQPDVQQENMFLHKPKWNDADYKKQYAIHHSECNKTAALSPFTGQILAAGILVCEVSEPLLGADIKAERIYMQGENSTENPGSKVTEQELLRSVIRDLNIYSQQGYLSVGKRLRYFDLPFLIQRALKYRIPVKTGGLGKIIDIDYIWQQMINGYDDYKEYSWEISLDRISRFLGGTIKKQKDIQKNFHKYFLETPDLAKGYLLEDLYSAKFIFEELNSYHNAN